MAAGNDLARRCTTNLIQRQFTAAEPDRVWLTDITEHATSQGKLYCCAIKDVNLRRAD